VAAHRGEGLVIGSMDGVVCYIRSLPFNRRNGTAREVSDADHSP